MLVNMVKKSKISHGETKELTELKDYGNIHNIVKAHLFTEN